jgi:exosortase
MLRELFAMKNQYRILFALGAAILAIHPLRWLVQSWREPSYASDGYMVAILVAILMLWSLRSGVAPPRPNKRSITKPMLILVSTAVIRLLGQLLGVHVIGAMALVLDLYAVGLLLGLERRPRSLSPGWLALLFAFSLPLERIVQRTIGYGLQHISAKGACELLSLGPDPVQCEGLRILINSVDVLVDLPCSGARSLLLLLMLFAALSAVTQPSVRRSSAGLIITMVAAVLTNMVRICMLAIGLAYPELVGGISVMDSPWHDAIGSVAFMMGAVPILIWALHIPKKIQTTRPSYMNSLAVRMGRLKNPPRPPRHRRLAALFFTAGCVVIILLPAHPVDVARKLPPPSLPERIGAFIGKVDPLSSQEINYFSRYGGGAARAAYGPFALLLVQTTAPLRHLHAPDECLSGVGHKVRYKSMRHTPIPTAVYQSTAPNGRKWNIQVTYVSDRGELSASVAEAIWRWLKNPTTSWTMVQRIIPWELAQNEQNIWDESVMRSLDLPFYQQPTSRLKTVKSKPDYTIKEQKS